LVAIPVAIGVNVLMLVTRMTRVVNVDIWNIWHMTFTGAMLHLDFYFYIPFFRKLKVTSAYEYLEARFDVRCRLFASMSFMLFHIG
ncbi:hypothetical protein ONQ62_26590, partial [Salmonella enterica subsp. enterica serovar Virginia]|nr:hypothetical protein [Salmonella enterica subsp. enterica serovar Virginia]